MQKRAQEFEILSVSVIKVQNSQNEVNELPKALIRLYLNVFIQTQYNQIWESEEY